MSRQSLDAAIAASIRRSNLRDAEQQGAWQIRKRKTLRVPSKTECEAKHVRGSLTCFHDIPYTVPCNKCRRSEADAMLSRDAIKRMLSIA